MSITSRNGRQISKPFVQVTTIPSLKAEAATVCRNGAEEVCIKQKLKDNEYFAIVNEDFHGPGSLHVT
jgi:hypothetical protein